MSLKFLIILFSVPIILNAQPVLVNSGQMSITINSTLFIENNTIHNNLSSVDLNGKMVVAGNFDNDVSMGNVFTANSKGMVQFTGKAMQHIKGKAVKNENYINFPNVTISKDSNYVVMNPEMGAGIKKLDLQKGKLLLSADDKLDEADNAAYNNFITSRMTNTIIGEVIYNRDITDSKQKGVVEVQMPLPGNINNRMFGFSLPYKAAYSDYFFANYIASPNQTGLLGTTAASIKNPETKLLAGMGYIIGQNILPTSRYTLDAIYGDSAALHTARFTDAITFNRYKFEENNNPIAVVELADKYNIEEINTSDVSVNLKKGWQYIGNPFTSNLDMNLFLHQSSGTDNWQSVRTDENTGGLSTRFLVQAGGEGVLDNWTPDKFYINPVWLVAQKEGSTIVRETNDRNVIAPMQMIAVYANEDITITIPASERTHKTSTPTIDINNELLIEVNNGKSFDRTVMVFRPGASTESTDAFDVSKRIDSLACPGHIFTISDDGYAMIANVVPETIKSIELGMVPALTDQTYVLTPHRIASLNTINEVWLEDRVSEGEWINLKSGANYTFSSKPNQRIDRFVLHINTPKGSQTVSPKLLSANLYATKGIPATNSIAALGTGPVGSVETNLSTTLTSHTMCEGTNTEVEIYPTVLNVNYSAYLQSKGGDSKGSVEGSGDKELLIGGTEKTDKYYLEAQSTDGVLAIARRIPVSIDFIKTMTYQDIRVVTCRTNQTLNLSKYLDTINFKSVAWQKLAGKSTLIGDKLQMTNNDRGHQIFSYTVTDVCKQAAPAKLYLSTNSCSPSFRDTITLCYETADAIQLNQIFGIDAGGEIKPTLEELTSEYLHISKTEGLLGATTFSGKAAYMQSGLLPDAPLKYGVNSKMAEFSYIPQKGSCLDKDRYKLVLIFTTQFPNKVEG